jgi:ankyrin repeat protein
MLHETADTHAAYNGPTHAIGGDSGRRGATMHEAAAAELMAAIQADDASRVEAVLDEVPSLVDGQGSGMTPLTLATYMRRPAIADLLIERGATLDVFLAAALDLPDRLAALLDEEPDTILAFSSDGWTPLHLAAHFGNVAATRLLLQRHADVHARSRSREGNTPLHAAIAGRQVETVRLLLEHGSDVNAADADGWTAINIAAHEGVAQIVELLLVAGADPTIPSDSGQTPRETAEREGNTHLLRYFSHVARPDPAS